jgi:hypothetical protein
MKKVIRLTEKELTNLVRRIVNEQIEDVYTDSREDFQYDIRGVRCDEDTFTSGHVDIDEDDVIVIRYCKGNEDSIERLKRKGERLLHSKYGM